MSRFQIAIVSILALIACSMVATIAIVSYAVLQPRQIAPAVVPTSTVSPSPPPTVAPSPTFVIYKFRGEGDKVETFQVSGDSPTFIHGAHRSTRQSKIFTVQIKDASGKGVAFPIATQGDSEAEKVLNLKPGMYFLEIHGENWTVTISPGQ